MIRYFATVAGFGRVSSFRVDAVSPAHARARALEMCGITVDVKPSSGHVGDDFDLPAKLTRAHEHGEHEVIPNAGCPVCQALA